LKFTLTIDMDSDAFQEGNNGNEVARILSKVVHQVDQDELAGGDGRVLRDGNGNTVGQWAVSEPKFRDDRDPSNPFQMR